MKLVHDLENDLEHTIPPEGDLDSQWLFREMTARSLDLLSVQQGEQLLDLGSGMGQDAMALADHPAQPGAVLGLEPSNRMIRFGQMRQRDGHSGGGTGWVRALGEELPFQAESFDGVICKGALDHFMAPHRTMGEVARILKPGGRAVVTLANYDSASCWLGARWDRMRALLTPGYRPPAYPFYLPPPDHLTRFGYREILGLFRPPLFPERVEGISTLWGFPPWQELLTTLPYWFRPLLLRCAFALGRGLPMLADVVVVRAVKHSPSTQPRPS